MKPTAFIVHGHDDKAKAALENFLKSLGIQVLTFSRAGANDLTGTNLDAALGGIERANVVFLLFTPDEQTSLHDPDTGQYAAMSENGEPGAGWQPRPNVLIEAGIAVAVARKKTALLKLGTIRRISDIDGVRHIEMHKPHVHDELWDFIRARVENLPEMNESVVEAFRRDIAAIRLPRWEFHDELGQLEADLRIQLKDSEETTFVDVLVEYVRAHPKESDWNDAAITDFFLQKYDFSRDQNNTDGFFWNLVIHGVFALTDIETWQQPRKKFWWHELQKAGDVTLAPRGKALLRKLKALRPAR